ncbi:hypothetical protein CDAR_72741 [Caerostris darwini]|uniref:Uncharacterized protein n=1 Tax=Caerostris darwini TaxID=1538125 RepID=A0AAV4MM69_9ARAC|nr:hypothetical protein CDAR_72741 [Caerostris darwini]
MEIQWFNNCSVIESLERVYEIKDIDPDLYLFRDIPILISKLLLRRLSPLKKKTQQQRQKKVLFSVLPKPLFQCAEMLMLTFSFENSLFWQNRRKAGAGFWRNPSAPPPTPRARCQRTSAELLIFAGLCLLPDRAENWPTTFWL